MPIQWEKQLAVGVDAIDRQHRELIDALNRLHGAMLASRAKDEVKPLVQFLESYTLKHFSEEEKLMRSVRYPGLAAHLLEHQGFAAKLRALAAEVVRSGATAVAAMQLNGAVSEWLRNHIMDSDRKVGAFMREQQRASAR